MDEAEPIQRQRGDLGPALIDAALDLLAAEGVDALSLRGVARRVGVSAMAPYRYFPDKAALLAAVARHGFEGLATAMKDASSSGDPREALVAIGVAYVAYAIDHPALFRLMFGSRCRSSDPDLRGARDATYAVLSGTVARAYPEAQHEALILGCWSLTHGLASLFLDGRLSDRAAGSCAEIAERVNRAMLALDGAAGASPAR
ncbi:TetR/AcrR family transcriptional regulator [Methylobacterium sp. J-030]|uniref:TetR/AcrR family transcriptional regulator n=1 Tax=Methylobacterium sp. J-030 TaxID=2836627 RepID=UPI001FBA2D98|nr:TetR/AcrR family transcriptional regulator [Methylobacterium sp. J-030]MCJ2070457.1 TetR/AcrR family transcriptional regulator [Methylobacterium sp. J-030]